VSCFQIINWMHKDTCDSNLTPSLKLPKNLIRLKTNSIKFPTNVGPNVKSIEIPCIGKKEEFSKKYPHIQILV